MLVAICHAITMNVNWSFQASKRTQKHHNIIIKVAYAMTPSLLESCNSFM